MSRAIITRAGLAEFLTRLDEAFARPARLYLIGETTQVFEEWRPYTTQIEFTADVAGGDRDAFSEAVAETAGHIGIEVIDESPGELIPLPEGYEERARPAAVESADNGGSGRIAIYHFDPYSVSFRFIARGDEPDYHLVLMYLKHGWITADEMDARLAALLPRFTAETIQQDPAEFRRKYKGLLQMWRAGRAGVTHRPTPA